MTITKKQVLKAIRKLQSELVKKIPTLNSGGCAYFAAELYNHLTEIDISGVDLPYIVVFGSPYNTDNDLNYIADALLANSHAHDIYEWNNNGVDFSHLAVYWNDENHDGHESFIGSVWGNYYVQHYGDLPIEALELILNDRMNESCWNPTYDSGKYNPIMRDIVAKHLTPLYNLV